jgi:hypothetical protein
METGASTCHQNQLFFSLLTIPHFSVLHRKPIFRLLTLKLVAYSQSKLFDLATLLNLLVPKSILTSTFRLIKEVKTHLTFSSTETKIPNSKKHSYSRWKQLARTLIPLVQCHL